MENQKIGKYTNNRFREGRHLIRCEPNPLINMKLMKLAWAVQSMKQLHDRPNTVSNRKEIKMISNVSHSLVAAVAALFSAALFVGASVGPAVGNAASIIA